MELRHTLEILTKDIQDIEKLVGNLQNSTRESSMELDLALSKLRNVYEVLTLIKADRLQEMISSVSETGNESAPSVPEIPSPPDTGIGEKSPPPSEGEENHLPDRSGSEATQTDEVSEQLGDPSKSADDEPAIHAEQDPEKPKEKAILAEKFSAESSINENMAGQRKAGKEARLVGQPIDSIHRNIGINDRFLIIRELFAGDADKFMELLRQLDEAGNYQKANELLKERFPATEEHEGIEILAGLIKRRFTTA
jgi:hypothetical protein